MLEGLAIPKKIKLSEKNATASIKEQVENGAEASMVKPYNN